MAEPMRFKTIREIMEDYTPPKPVHHKEDCVYNHLDKQGWIRNDNRYLFKSTRKGETMEAVISNDDIYVTLEYIESVNEDGEPEWTYAKTSIPIYYCPFCGCQMGGYKPFNYDSTVLWRPLL